MQSLDSTGELLAALVAVGRPLSLRDLAAFAGMPAAKAFPHLVSLQKIGLIERDRSGWFAAGPLAFELGMIGLQRLSPAREAEAEIVELAASSGMSVAMAVLGPLGPTVVRLEEAARPVHVSLRVGTVMSLVNTAIGRVFAAWLPEDVRERLLAQDHLRLAGVEAAQAFEAESALTSLASSEAGAYGQRLAQIHADGLDAALDKPIPGISTLAAPVFDHTGSICLAIAVMGTTGSFDSEGEGAAAHALLAATRRLSKRFGFIAAGESSRQA
ncbi:IclR family transcriptional regulator [Paraburkholderia phosphatilytica]|uniref:IclR family transcriptional regulator n=1 Tax=Paraburkholderia phosphatilytica TaxID=2282883 RepID=UPI001F0BFA8F|nr:IclR family transcriptional regulator [Paraburkholderia phosphatilytica]